jgi:hypothetical protein
MCLCVALATQAQLKETEVKAPITAVKLHINGATVEHTSGLQLQPGRNIFIFPELSSKLYPQTVQFNLDNPAIKVLSVTSKTNFLRRILEDPRVIAMRDSVDVLRDKIQLIDDESAAYKQEQELLRVNIAIKGSDKTLSVAEIKATADFYRSRHLEINKALTQNENQLVKLGRKLFDLKLQLHELNATQEPTSELVLVVESPAAIRSNVSFRYVVSDAGWAAIYDLESNNSDKTIKLRYRGQAYNNTGIDWNDVRLTLSTADPLETALQPSLRIWNLDNYSAGQIQTITLSNSNLNINFDMSENNFQKSMPEYNRMELDISARTVEIRDILGPDFRDRIDYETEYYRRYRAEKLNKPQLTNASLDVPEFNIDFPVKEPFSIPSDKKPYSIDISEHNLNVSYKHYAVPKMDRDAFLLAQIVGWEDLDLVSGPVNIYNGTKYIGQSNLNIRNLSDTLSVSLGRDKEVVVTRLKVAGKSRKMVLGGMNKVSVAYNISARNNRSYPIDVEIQDQVPISSDKDVLITVDELGGAHHEPKVGTLTWRFTLQPGETRTVEFGFTVRFPEGKTVEIQYKQSRSMEQMRYF